MSYCAIHKYEGDGCTFCDADRQKDAFYEKRVRDAEELRRLHEHIAALTAERNAALADAAKWKANHENQGELHRAIKDRPDLGDRASRVQASIAERDALRKELAEERDRTVAMSLTERRRMQGELAALRGLVEATWMEAYGLAVSRHQGGMNGQDTIDRAEAWNNSKAKQALDSDAKRDG